MRPGDLLEQRYRLVRVLGRGRSGSVWCARNELIDRGVAIKILHRSLASDPERLQRFFQEARACGRVRHPAVVEVLDLGQGDDGVLFLVMELLEGETLSSLLARKGRLGTDEALSIIIPLARGLAAAHAHGILHRDLKPANIYLHKTPTGGLQPKILDFGISKILGSELTQSGVVLGTPSYMSPEQARGVPDLDPRMDVWSLGVILYECLGGQLPFLAREYRALVEEILERKHLPIEQLAPEVPPELARVLDEALEKSRERRVSSAASLAQKLTSLLRARGGIDLLKEPEDEFSESAPTLARDRDYGNKPPIDETVGDHRPVPNPHAQVPDKTVVNAAPLPAAPLAPTPAPKAPARPVLRGGSTRPTPIIVQPSAQTAAIAAQTSGGKRVSAVMAPRPAAGTPARKTGMTGPQSVEAVAAEVERLRIVEVGAAPAKDADSAGGHGWELNFAKAASGRDRNEVSTAEVAPLSAEKAASMLGGSGLPASSAKLRVDDNWDTTVADVSPESMQASGSAPELAPVPAPATKAFANPPRISVQKTAQGIAAPSAAAIAQVAAMPPNDGTPARPGLGSIPGFSTAAPSGARRGKTPTIPPMAVVQKIVKTRSAPPGPPPKSNPPPRPPSTPNMQAVRPGSMRPGALEQEISISKTKPPRPPPKSMPPGAGPGARQTMRPQGEGFGAAMPAPSPSRTPSNMPPRPPPKSMPPPADAPLVAPELFGLGSLNGNSNGHDQGVPIDFMSEHSGAPPPAVANDAPVPSSDRASDIPPIGPPPNNLEDTDRRARAAMPIVPFLAAAVAVLFIVGAVLGTVAAKTRASEHAVRRFVNAQTLIIALRDRSQQLDDEVVATEAANQIARDAEKLAADQKAAAAAAKIKADEEAAALVAAAASASADASASASGEAATASPPDTATTSALAAPIPPTPAPTPKATAKPKWTPPPPKTPAPKTPAPKLTTTAKPKATATPKKPSSTDPPKKAKGEKEWWEKKF